MPKEKNLGKHRTETVFGYELLCFLSRKGLCTLFILSNQLQKLLGWLAEKIYFIEKVMSLKTVLFHIKLKARNVQPGKTRMEFS